MRVAAAVLVAASALVVAACGSLGTTSPTAKEVEGTLPQQETTPALAKGDPASGKKLFASNGCSGCHTYTPAGSNAKVGPDLDKLAEYSQKGHQGPLPQLVWASTPHP